MKTSIQHNRGFLQIIALIMVATVLYVTMRLGFVPRPDTLISKIDLYTESKQIGKVTEFIQSFLQLDVIQQVRKYGIEIFSAVNNYLVQPNKKWLQNLVDSGETTPDVHKLQEIPKNMPNIRHYLR